MAASRTFLIAGGGIAGLTSALALARNGLRAVVFEQSSTIDPIGAGIQLTPNAMNVLLGLGLGDALEPYVVAPDEIRVRKANNGSDIVRVPLGQFVRERYGAPYYVVHRADLQSVLLDAARANPDISVRLGAKVHDYVVHANGVTAQVRFDASASEERCVGLIGADGLWSGVRNKLGFTDPPHFRKRTAWRTVIPAEAVPEEMRKPVIHLWLGHHAHLVHYPIRAGKAINVVAIMRDLTAKDGWKNTGTRDEILWHFRKWAVPARALVASAQNWTTWSLYDRPKLRRWGDGPITMVGDAAHPMLPFLAQGAAMAIEDSVVLADCLAKAPDDAAAGMRRYESLRNSRTARVQKAASRNGLRYQASGVEAAVRNAAMRMLGGRGLIKRYDWLYRWRPDER